jgi:transcriptional regulator GlxA family with amidase domain
MTVTDYINRTRVRRAEALLGKTALPMQAIAEQCGFSDANYFTRTFKKINDVSPNDYRKSLTAHSLPTA